MNMDQLEGKWETLKGQVEEKWGKLTNDDLTLIKGKTDKLMGKLQERYGYTVEKAKEEIHNFMHQCNCSDDSKDKKADKHIL